MLYYLPSRVWFAEMIAQRQPPWLNPWTGLDRPYLADPQSAVGYPFTWLFAALPVELAYPASLWAHYSLALLGMVRLLRAQRMRLPAALVGAVAFAFCGFLIAHRTHLAMQHAAAWTPWVFWRIERFVRLGGARRGASAAVCCGLQCFAGHLQVAALCALGAMVLTCPPRAGAIRRVARWATVWFAAAGLYGVQLLPTLLYLGQCTRTSQTYLQFTENSWNPLSVVGFAVPMFFGQRVPNAFDQRWWGPSHQVEQFAYCGVVTLLLAWVAIRCRRTDAQPWIRLLVFGLLLALGLYGPVCPLLYWIPGASVFRVPARAMLLCHLALAVLAATAVQQMTGRLRPEFARSRAAALSLTRRPVVVAVGVVVIPLVAAALAWPVAPTDTRTEIARVLRVWRPQILIPIAIWLLSLAALRWTARGWRAPARVWLPAIVLLADLSVIGWSLDVPRRHPGLTGVLAGAEKPAWVDRIPPASGRLWVIAQREGDTPGQYVRPLRRCVANTNILYGVPSLTDYGPLQPKLFAGRFGFRPWGECERPEPLLANQSLLDACDVGWILICDAAVRPPPGTPLIWTDDGSRLFRTADPRGMAFVAEQDISHTVRYQPLGPHRFNTIVDFWTPADEPRRDTATLVVSRLALTGWSASIDGRPTPLRTWDHLLLACDVPTNRTVTIKWRYAPPGLPWGIGLTVVTAAALLAGAIRGDRPGA
ncbi:MAG: hypothetical protein D6744_11385 [Planctomycetota bacterium]|nr:MAG: hypothetical protein D6744_11385 [Planctomycetota bacterium]